MTNQQALENARQAHRAGRLSEAEALYHQILTTEPCNADALHFLGVIAGQTGRHTEAVEWFRQSIEEKPDNPEALKNLGVALKAIGRVDDAIAACRQAIALKPDYAEAHKNLGGLFHGKGHLEEAIAAYRQAITFRPGYAEACSNLGAALREAGKLGESIAACRRAIALNKALPEAHSNLGNALFDQRAYDEAIAAYRDALQLAPRFAAAWHNLGIALESKGQPDEAIAAYQMAVELRPDHADAFTKLGHMLKEQGRISEAIDAYRKAIKLRPDSPDWQHVLAALSGDTSPTGTPASYVRKLFDPYADDFDAHLVEKLGYHVPEMMLEAVLSVAPGRKFDILDLGCGTGLCGAQFRPHANHLSGVDLSPAMLAKAAARGIYDRLITGDISEAMRDQEQCCDLLLAGDLFVYVGDLDGVLQSASRMLRSGGLLAFSLERHEGEGFVLHSKIRFAHSLAYIRGLAHAHRFSELIANEITVRNSGTAPVAGWLVVLQAK